MFVPKVQYHKAITLKGEGFFRSSEDLKSGPILFCRWMFSSGIWASWGEKAREYGLTVAYNSISSRNQIEARTSLCERRVSFIFLCIMEMHQNQRFFLLFSESLCMYVCMYVLYLHAYWWAEFCRIYIYSEARWLNSEDIDISLMEQYVIGWSNGCPPAPQNNYLWTTLHGGTGRNHLPESCICMPDEADNHAALRFSRIRMMPQSLASTWPGFCVL